MVPSTCDATPTVHRHQLDHRRLAERHPDPALVGEHVLVAELLRLRTSRGAMPRRASRSRCASRIRSRCLSMRSSLARAMSAKTARCSGPSFLAHPWSVRCEIPTMEHASRSVHPLAIAFRAVGREVAVASDSHQRSSRREAAGMGSSRTSPASSSRPWSTQWQIQSSMLQDVGWGCARSAMRLSSLAIGTEIGTFPVS